MSFRTLSFTTLLIFLSINSIIGQTCTSSGGDDLPPFDDDYPRFRCGTAMMHDRMQKVSSDFKPIKSCDIYWADGDYFNNKGIIYFSFEYGSFEPVVGADVKSFRCEDGTAKDNATIYFKGKAVSNIDNASFKSVGLAYCSDNKNVFYRNRYTETGEFLKIAGAESSSFKIIGDANSSYAKDSITVYFCGKSLEFSDPLSFTLLEYGYAHDKNYAYYNGIRIEGMKGVNFKVLKDCYLGSDGVILSNGNNVLKNSDAISFKAIECGYYQDNNNVYLNGTVLEGIDSKSFEVLDWGYSKDKNAVYCDLKLIEGADPESFEVLGRKHSKDKGNIFYLHHTMNCDYASFELDLNIDYLSQDKNYNYSRGVQIK